MTGDWTLAVASVAMAAIQGLALVIRELIRARVRWSTDDDARAVVVVKVRRLGRRRRPRRGHVGRRA